MNKTQVEIAVFDVLRMYWRRRASFSYLRSNMPSRLGSAKNSPLDYRNIPAVGRASNFLANETLGAALLELERYENERVINDIFLAMISRLEEFLSGMLIAKNKTGEGTLGQLLRRAEQAYAISGPEVANMVEVRQRRNAIVHHHGRETPEHASAAANVTHPGFASAVRAGVMVTDAGYLSYAADVLVAYVHRYP